MVYVQNVVWTTGKRMKNIPRHAENASAEHIHEAEHTTAEKENEKRFLSKTNLSKKQTQHSEVKNIKVIFTVRQYCWYWRRCFCRKIILKQIWS